MYTATQHNPRILSINSLSSPLVPPRCVMAEDSTRPDAGRLPKKDEKRKKRKPKKKKLKKDADQVNGTANNEQLELKSPASPPLMAPATPSSANVLSPRKQTIMRHKKSDDSVGEPLFVSEAKEYKKNRKSVATDAEDGKFSLMLANQNMEGRTSLIVCPLAKIVVYHEQLPDRSTKYSSGTLLAHGEFEIFQLHNGDVTYLSCGRSFVYPLLPKLKMLRTSRSEFVLPLVNPQRYWKIHIDSDDDAQFEDLELVLAKVVNYTNIWFAEGSAQPRSPVAQANGQSPRAGHVKGLGGPKASHMSPLFSTIPESPPSAPVSPHNLNLFDDNFELLPKRSLHPSSGLRASSGLLRKQSGQSITSAMASFSVEEPSNGIAKYHQPKPVAHSNPYIHKSKEKIADTKSDTSSMDSLLDEYEENISTTKSINYNLSRPPSRAVSMISSHHPAHVQYQRGKVAILPDYASNLSSNYGALEEEDDADPFPSTSLSQYNRARKGSHDNRSRKSSVSELYNSVSTWMEPGHQEGPVLAHSRSLHSLASRNKNSARAPNLTETYREIYRSITLHNLASVARDTSSVKSCSTSNPLRPPRPSADVPDPYYSKLLTSEQVGRPVKREQKPRKAKADGLSSTEVYRLLSDREHKPKATGLGRLFGW